MKKLISAVMILLTLTFCNSTTMEAKVKVAPKMYIFGFSASFKNSIVYFTDIQEGLSQHHYQRPTSHLHS